MSQGTLPDIPKCCNKEGDIAFTFDQGPSQYTGLLLSTLSQAKVKGTFHISPDYLDNPVLTAYLRRIASDGHLIGIYVKDTIAEDDLRGYLVNVTSALKSIINYEPMYLRFPVPGPSPRALKIVKGLGYVVSSYNLDSQDYNYVNDDAGVDGREEVKGQIFQIFKQTLDQILPPSRGAFIAVQRDIVMSSVQQTAEIIKYAKEKGYNPVRLDTCLGRNTIGGGGSGKGGEKDTGTIEKKDIDDSNTNTDQKKKKNDPKVKGQGSFATSSREMSLLSLLSLLSILTFFAIVTILII